MGRWSGGGAVEVTLDRCNCTMNAGMKAVQGSSGATPFLLRFGLILHIFSCFKGIQVWDIRIHFPVEAAATRVRGVRGATRFHRCVRVCVCVCVCAAERH